MTFNFDEKLTIGKKSAEDVIQHRKELQNVIEELEKAINKFLNIDAKLILKPNSNDVSTALFAEEFGELTTYQEYNLNIIDNDGATTQNLFSIKIQPGIYPMSVMEDKQYTVVDTKHDLVEVIGDIMANAPVHLKLKSFVKRMNESSPF